MRHLVAKLVIQTNSLPSVFTFLSFDTKELSRLKRCFVEGFEQTHLEIILLTTTLITKR